MNSMQKAVCSRQCRTSGERSLPTAYCLLPTYSRAFTLTEILIVIGLIVLLLVLALPALDFISGSRSIDGAQNQISAMLGRARAEAIGLQEPKGIAFFRDPANDRITMALVDYVPNSDQIDFIEDRDQQVLPPGVGMHLVYDNTADPTYPYIEYGVILFDAFGRVLHDDFEVVAGSAFEQQFQQTIALMGSQFGFVLYDRASYVNKPDDPSKLTYLNDESLPVLVNRYNGTLVKGE